MGQHYLMCVSDLHQGSLYALKPPSFIRSGGIEIGSNRNQLRLYEAWKKMCDIWGKPDVCIVNGDAIDGVQRANQGVEVWTTDISEQVDSAAELLEMIKAKKYYFIGGSDYHSKGTGIKYERELANKFGSDLYNDLSGNFRGHTMHFAHHIGVSQVFHYRTTPLARELLTALCNQKSLYNYEWTVRSHAHYVVEARYKTHRGIITPAWQLRTPYTIRLSPFMISDIGAVRFHEVKHEVLGDERDSTLDVEVAFWRHPKPDLMDLENREIIAL